MNDLYWFFAPVTARRTFEETRLVPPMALGAPVFGSVGVGVVTVVRAVFVVKSVVGYERGGSQADKHPRDPALLNTE